MTPLGTPFTAQLMSAYTKTTTKINYLDLRAQMSIKKMFRCTYFYEYVQGQPPGMTDAHRQLPTVGAPSTPALGWVNAELFADGPFGH